MPKLDKVLDAVFSEDIYNENLGQHVSNMANYLKRNGGVAGAVQQGANWLQNKVQSGTQQLRDVVHGQPQPAPGTPPAPGSPAPAPGVPPVPPAPGTPPGTPPAPAPGSPPAPAPHVPPVPAPAPHVPPTPVPPSPAPSAAPAPGSAASAQQMTDILDTLHSLGAQPGTTAQSLIAALTPKLTALQTALSHTTPPAPHPTPAPAPAGTPTSEGFMALKMLADDIEI